MTLLAALVGAVAALAGQALAPVIQSSRAHRQWLRDKRSEVFEQYFALLQQAEAEAHFYRSGLEASGPQARLYAFVAERRRDRVSSLIEPMLEATARLELYASTGVASEAKQATETFLAFLEEAESPNTVKRRVDLLVQFLSEAGAARQAIRKELRIPDL